jgi:hypothetical protein
MHISRSSSSQALDLIDKLFEDKRRKTAHTAVRQHALAVAKNSSSPTIKNGVNILA